MNRKVGNEVGKVRKLSDIPADKPVLIAGATASGKSALALQIAESAGGVIVNADAIQVFSNWRILTARPTEEEEASAPHMLYGHVRHDASYSVGHWLRDLHPVIKSGERPIIVGGTGLYFTALTEGLADIPPTPPDIRAEADQRRKTEGHAGMLAELGRRHKGPDRSDEPGARTTRLGGAARHRAWDSRLATDDTAAAAATVADTCNGSGNRTRSSGCAD